MTQDREPPRIVSLFPEHPRRKPAPEPDPDPEDSLSFWDPAIQISPPGSLPLSRLDVGASQVESQTQSREKRIPLEVYLRPLEGLSLPGQAEIERYVHHKYRRNMKRRTLEGTVSNGKLFLGFLGQQGRRSVQEIRREDLEAYVEQDRGMKPCTVKARLSHGMLSSVF